MTPTGALSAGSRIAGRYHIEACIGTGATSTVYRALDLRNRDAVALKVLDPLLARDEVSLERFSREMQALRAVAHPHVVRVFALGRDDDVWFLSMAYVDGPTLRAHLDKKGRLGAEELVTLGSKLASGLDTCHRAGVVHRDVKPGNIMLEASTEPKLVDFGVAAVCAASHLTRTGTYLGTPDYMAPEQFVKATADPRSDLFSLGVVLYESLTDRLPYRSRSLARIAERNATATTEDIVPPSLYFPEIPAWLDAIVLKCLEPCPENRYQSAWELEEDLAKGAQSLAQYRSRNAQRVCLRCRASMVHGLAFCHQCGTLVVDHFESGNHSVVLYRCDDTEDFAERVSTLGAVTKPAAVLKRLGTLPRVLIRGVDESTARAVVSELFGARAELGVATTLPKELRLPRHYLGYGLATFAAALALGNLLGILSVLVGVVSSYAVLFALYVRRVQPLIESRELPTEGAHRLTPGLVALAPRIGRLRNRDTKELLALIVRNFQIVAEPLQTEALFELVERAVSAGETMDRCELSLSGRSLVELAESRAALVHRLSSSSGIGASEDIIHAKASVDKEIRSFRDLRDLHTRLHFGLINLNRALRALESTDGVRFKFDVSELDRDSVEVLR